LDTRATVRKGMYQISVAIVVPERTRIDPSFCALDQEWCASWSSRIFSLDHVDAVIRIGIEDVEITVVISNCRRPDTVTMLRSGKHIYGCLILKCVTDDSPVNEIFRVKDRKA